MYRLEELRLRLARSMESSRPLRVKFGMDPTSPDIHLGHTVPLRKLRQFQDLGHHVVLIIGDYTAMIGDPSGRSKTRPRLSSDEIERNLQTYLAQVSKVLDASKLEITRNGKWFSAMTFRDVLALAGRATVAQMIERDDFSKRLRDGVPVGLHELLYPLMQGWDSVEVRADVELGGTDQTFNLMAGRDLQKNEGQEQQVAITTPILPGLDGVEKMSKSLDNYVALEDTPGDMFGKLMSIPDALLETYFELLTLENMHDVREHLRSGRNPRDLKERLALIIVGQYHGAEAARSAADEFRRIFAEKGIPDDAPEVSISPEDAASVSVVDLLLRAGHAPSRSEARRLLRQGAVRIDDEKITGEDARLALKNGAVLKTGKRRFARITTRPGG
ncbi:MAG TPA: tyrosine--tRNA ligase [Planctomycetes bacterium]|nr:tyrosine--tRNA ligase [Planctomycetota bacterium]